MSRKWFKSKDADVESKSSIITRNSSNVTMVDIVHENPNMTPPAIVPLMRTRTMMHEVGDNSDTESEYIRKSRFKLFAVNLGMLIVSLASAPARILGVIVRFGVAGLSLSTLLLALVTAIIGIATMLSSGKCCGKKKTTTTKGGHTVPCDGGSPWFVAAMKMSQLAVSLTIFCIVGAVLNELYGGFIDVKDLTGFILEEVLSVTLMMLAPFALKYSGAISSACCQRTSSTAPDAQEPSPPTRRSSFDDSDDDDEEFSCSRHLRGHSGLVTCGIVLLSIMLPLVIIFYFGDVPIWCCALAATLLPVAAVITLIIQGIRHHIAFKREHIYLGILTIVAITVGVAVVILLYSFDWTTMQKWMSTRDEKCFTCLCEHTGGCDVPPRCQRNTRGDIVCGYYQISKNLYQDAMFDSSDTPDTIAANWQKCVSDRDCATNVLLKYAARTTKSNCRADDLSETLTCETIVRARSGGCMSLSGEQFWLSKIKKCYLK